MIQPESITQGFAAHGHLRKSQRKTLAALVWALLTEPLLGVAVIGRTLARAKTTSVKHAVKRVDRFLGNGRIDLVDLCQVHGHLKFAAMSNKGNRFHPLGGADYRCPRAAPSRLPPGGG